MRPDWPEYFMDMATLVSTRATCPRRSVGAVIVRDKRVVGTGYNGSLPDMPHCDDAGCIMTGGHCTRTIHAEANAILQATKYDISLAGAELYSTCYPCSACMALISGAGISRIYYRDEYTEIMEPPNGVTLTRISGSLLGDGSFKKPPVGNPV